MADDIEVRNLLEKSIEAQNRTTHAVRAFVRFVLIQLTATTLAAGLLALSFWWQESFLTLAAFVTVTIGIIWSSIAGWNELALSDRFREARALRLEKSILSARQRRASRARKFSSLVATKRFKVSVALGLTILIGPALILFMVSEYQSGQQATQRAEMDARSEAAVTALEAEYTAALDDCEGSTGRDLVSADIERELGIAYLELKASGTSPDEVATNEFVKCVTFELTAKELSDLELNSKKVQGDFILEFRSFNLIEYLTFRPNIN